MKPTCSILVSYAEAIGGGPRSLAPTVYESGWKNEFEEIHQLLPIYGFSQAPIFRTTGSNNELTPGHSATSSPEHESTKIEPIGCTDSQWKANDISEKCDFFTKFYLRFQ